MGTDRLRSLRVALSAAAIAAGVGHADPLSELDDAAARMQYAFYAADVRGIDDALTQVRRLRLPESRKGTNEYYTAYAQWKMAELYADEAIGGRKESRAKSAKAAGECARAAGTAIRLDSKLAEAHAMQAMCIGLAGRAPEILSLSSCVRHRGLRTARELEPRNPRVRLIEAQCKLASDKDAVAMLEPLRTLARDFEADSGGPGQPDWGHAETLLLLSSLQAQTGDFIGARDSLERALVLAPDYRRARAQLQQLANGAGERRD